MTFDEKALLLTVARTMRAKIRDEIYAEQAADLEALNEALAPFDPDPQHGGDFEQGAATESPPRG